MCQADDISYSIIIFFSSIAAFHVALLFLLLLPFLVGACKTLTALSRLFVCQPLPLLCNLGGLQGPRGQGTLNTDSMCDVSPHYPHVLSPRLAKLGAGGVRGGQEPRGFSGDWCVEGGN